MSDALDRLLRSADPGRAAAASPRVDAELSGMVRALPSRRRQGWVAPLLAVAIVAGTAAAIPAVVPGLVAIWNPEQDTAGLVSLTVDGGSVAGCRIQVRVVPADRIPPGGLDVGGELPDPPKGTTWTGTFGVIPGDPKAVDPAAFARVTAFVGSRDWTREAVRLAPLGRDEVSGPADAAPDDTELAAMGASRLGQTIADAVGAEGIDPQHSAAYLTTALCPGAAE